MQKNYIFLLSLLVVLAGCGGKDKKKTQATGMPKKKTMAPKKVGANGVKVDQVDIPLASNEVKSYFDDEDVNLGEFVLVEGSEVEIKDKEINGDEASETTQSESSDKELRLEDKDLDDFSWVQEVEEDTETFKKCHFDFDRYDVREDQEKKIEDNIKLAKKMIEEGGVPTVVIEGHACNAAGSRTYNMALSEKRAKVIADRFIEAGISRDNIKIVGRGNEVLEKDKNGNDIVGDKYQQWPNRRSEIRVIYN